MHAERFRGSSRSADRTLAERLERLRSLVKAMGWIRFRECLRDERCLEELRREVV